MSENRSNIRVTQAQIDRLVQNAVVSVETRFDKVTVVCCRLENGFVITEAAGCVDPVNYSQDTGFKICMERIENKLWELEGYALQKQVHERKNAKCCEGSAREMVNHGLSFGTAITAVKAGHRIAREGWNGKSQYVELADCISYRNSACETVNANHQAIGNKALAFVGTSGVQLGWLASQADMLADDWYIVN